MPKNALCRKEFTNKDLGLQVRTITNEDGSISINAEDTAIGFGWVKTENKNGKVYTSIRWDRMNGFSKECGFDHEWSKDDYIPESLFYRLGMKASNKVADAFQNWLAMEVIPSIRKIGSYSTSQPKPMSAKEELRLHYQYLEEQSKEIELVREEVTEVREEVTDLKDNMPLFNIECKELQALVRSKGVQVLGGYKSTAYNDHSLRGKVYSDIQRQLKREFGISKYEAIKRSQLDIARRIVEEYKAPTVLVLDISKLNNQMRLT